MAICFARHLVQCHLDNERVPLTLIGRSGSQSMGPMNFGQGVNMVIFPFCCILAGENTILNIFSVL